MELHWSDVQRIAEELYDADPDLDPLTLSFVKLHDMVVKLPDFADDPQKSNEQILEAILQAWLNGLISFDLPIRRLCSRPSAAVHEGCRSAFPVFGQTENILIDEVFSCSASRAFSPGWAQQQG